MRVIARFDTLPAPVALHYSHFPDPPMPRRTRPLSPRKRPAQRRSRDTVEAILEAAAQVLDAAGYAGLNTNAIAARAGISVGSLYQYFPNKQAICAELTRRYVERQAAAFAENLRQTFATDPRGQIRRTVKTALDIARSDRRGATLLYQHLRQVPEDRTYANAQKAMEAALRRHYESPAGRAAFRNPDMAAFFTVHLMGTLLGEVLAHHPQWLGEARLDDELTALFVAYLAGGALRAGA